NVCGIGIPATKTLKSAPAVPGSVSGPKLVEKNKTGLVYSVLPAVSGVTYYWTASNGAKITLGQNSPSITVTWGVSNGKITVKAINECDTSSGTSVDVNVLGLLAEGSETQDPVSSAQFNTTPPHSFYVLPNPANDFAYLIFKSTTAYNFTIEVTDPSGKIFQRIKDHALKGENKIKIDVHNYTAGIYFITVTDDKGLRNTIKLLKD
ncbi:MAG TPA: T9SS type A sorting domain-containing protein, partial [Panacibacter sp.]|nr:T9SS type A sorting domain-containing protein [Panacibacter sp.]